MNIIIDFSSLLSVKMIFDMVFMIKNGNEYVICRRPKMVKSNVHVFHIQRDRVVSRIYI